MQQESHPGLVRVGAVLAMAAALVVGVSMPANAVYGPNLVVDGGFEDDVLQQLSSPAWSNSTTSNSAVFADNHSNPDSGSHYLNGLADFGVGFSAYHVQQDIPTVAGDMYFVSFATRAGENATVQVHSGSTTLQTLTVSPTEADGASYSWTTYSYTFFAAPGTTSTTISLLSEISRGGFQLAQFDSVVVQRVPVEDTPLISPIVGLAAAGVVVVVAAGTAVTVSRRRRLA